MFNVRWMAAGWFLSFGICLVAIQPLPVSDDWKEFIAAPMFWGLTLGLGAYGRSREERACRQRSRSVYAELRQIHGDDVPRVYP